MLEQLRNHVSQIYFVPNVVTVNETYGALGELEEWVWINSSL